jgi:predicted transcriptional regulator
LAPNNTVREAGKKMHEKTIDQIPVFDEGDLKGLVTIDIVNEYTERKDTKIRNVMNPKPPVVDFEFPANALSQLTRISGCVLVEKNSKIIGIITSSDLLKMM